MKISTKTRPYQIKMNEDSKDRRLFSFSFSSTGEFIDLTSKFSSCLTNCSRYVTRLSWTWLVFAKLSFSSSLLSSSARAFSSQLFVSFRFGKSETFQQFANHLPLTLATINGVLCRVRCLVIVDRCFHVISHSLINII